ncbi:threonine/serine exporter family protein [Anaeromassilibacillus senegalensis]|uniref:threonine/serine exporter family protein n=1 Tax=Anaeromassilibacillus senegalensis TaxID=1673717 RepID=UPI000682626D|nr:threonine/serine exporter family protein [Anaeromassilibacillus senegalensis]
MNYDELVNTTMEVGYLLLSNGAEIYRVEDSMRRIFRAYGVETGDVFVIPTCIFATVETGQGKPITGFKRLYTRVTNLDKVERANDLCRVVCYKKPDFQTVREEVRSIDQRPAYGFWTQVAAYALIAFSFTLFYSGSFADACCALVCGAAVRLVIDFMGRFSTNSFFMNIAASCVAATLALLAVQFGFGANTDKIIIGALMNLVPGIVITSFMRDVIAGDLIAGLIRFVESLLVATAIAIGAGVALLAPRLIWGV